MQQTLQRCDLDRDLLRCNAISPDCVPHFQRRPAIIPGLDKAPIPKLPSVECRFEITNQTSKTNFPTRILLDAAQHAGQHPLLPLIQLDPIHPQNPVRITVITLVPAALVTAVTFWNMWTTVPAPSAPLRKTLHFWSMSGSGTVAFPTGSPEIIRLRNPSAVPRQVSSFIVDTSACKIAIVLASEETGMYPSSCILTTT